MTTLTRSSPKTIKVQPPLNPSPITTREVFLLRGLDSKPKENSSKLSYTSSLLAKVHLTIDASKDQVSIEKNIDLALRKKTRVRLPLLRQWIWRLESGLFNKIEGSYFFDTTKGSINTCAIGAAYYNQNQYTSLRGLPLSHCLHVERDLAKALGLPPRLLDLIPSINDEGTPFPVIAKLLRQFLPDPQEILL